MKYSRTQTQSKAHAVPTIQFETQKLTSFAGLVIIQKFFAAIELKKTLRGCFAHLNNGKIFNRTTLFMQLITHLLLGFRELKDCRFYRDDPMVKRLLGLNRIPDTATLSRFLKEITAETIEHLRYCLREMVLTRMQLIAPPRITMDFDGSVQSTSRRAEGTAVGFNKKKKGARSYYPLFCTIAQTTQVLDFLHRPGNVHDSNGAKAFILACIDCVAARLPYTLIEVRMDSAFFSDDIVAALTERGIEFTVSVPFERFVELKGMIEQRRRWHTLDADTSYFEAAWKPQCWDKRFRFVFIRTRTQRQQKGPIQLDLFVPYEYGYEFKVIITNKTLRPKGVTAYHEGRGAQEGIFGELKSHCHQGYIPVRSLHGNQAYLLAGLFAYNLVRELQMRTTQPLRHTTAKRASLWVFEKVDTLRKTLLQRAGRFTRPKGRLTLTISANQWIQRKLTGMLGAIQLGG
ncbi:MAG: IS1380 family transposase [Planctomycetes bacterium]|nr:IS1380 family transposase [Planctomycetota bacterium]